MVALKPKDGYYVPFQSAFEQQHVSEFIDSIRIGAAKAAGVQVRHGTSYSLFLSLPCLKFIGCVMVSL